MAARPKQARELNATLVFTDEGGFLMLPLLRRTLAPRGRTPVLRHRASHRDKVSVAAALTLSPARGHVSLYYLSRRVRRRRGLRELPARAAPAGPQPAGARA